MLMRLLVLLTAIGVYAPAVSAQVKYARITSGATDPLKIMISLDHQQLTVYRGIEPVASTRISTGKRGHRTPAGIFSILQKRKWHRSNIYSNAPMPYMQRLTWSGIALHQGYVPRYPASHGCIRLPEQFARELFSMTELGVQVLISGDKTKPEAIKHAKLLQPRPLDLVTMDERDVLLRWSQEKGWPWKWIPLPVRAPKIQTVSASGIDITAAINQETEQAAQDASGSNSDDRKMSVEQKASLELADFEYDLEQIDFYENRSMEPLRILITQRNGAERIRDLQKLLLELGHDPGDIDGYQGRETRAAIRSFQEAYGIEVTGKITTALVERLYKEAKSGPAPSGHIYVKQDRKRIFDAPVSIADPDKPLGTHLYSVLGFDLESMGASWIVVGADDESDPAEALDRITLPPELRDRLERLLTPGSSIIISDGGLSPETNKHTDFVVSTN